MPSRTSVSPSPPTAPSVDAANQPGIRGAKICEIYAGALQATLKSNSYTNFASCFPTPAKYCPTALEGVHKQLNARLEEECQKDFEKILDERKVIQGLNEWDAVLDAARRRRDRSVDGEQPEGNPTHTLSAEELNAAFTYMHLSRAATELTSKLQTTQEGNQQVMSNIQAQRAEIERLVGGLESLIKDVEGSVSALEVEDGRDLRQDVWKMEQELKGTRDRPTAVSDTSMG